MTLEERVASWRGEASEDGESMVAEPDPDACIREALEAPESPMVAEPESDACICESPAEPESPMMAEASLKFCRTPVSSISSWSISSSAEIIMYTKSMKHCLPSTRA